MVGPLEERVFLSGVGLNPEAKMTGNVLGAGGRIDDPLWYKDALIYELHVRSFCDSDGDGVGDFRGLTSRLDYLQDLGITALWLLPFFPSPLRDDGYDTADYRAVHPRYGTLRDFKAFLREAHRRGLRVITELVLNHTSDQHPWFQRSRKARPGSRWRDFYVWSDTPHRYGEARIIFRDFEASNWTWDPEGGAYYWHRFYAHQPDLNYDNPHVRKTMLEVLDFWFDAGVDGLRLDAVPYLFEREGTNCENLPQTYDYLREVRGHIDGKYTGRMLLAEANQWPEDAVAYFGEGDMCHMAFHFPIMPRLFMALRMEDRHPVLDILDQTPPIPGSCQWAYFLRNHDELTLEMVTDEERDYMYRVYAHDRQMRINLGIRRRLAPLVGNDRRRIELLNSLLFSLPGTPVLYYGDEIGMGDNVYLGDRNGVRTPMQWNADRNAGFSRANPQQLYLPVIIDPGYHYETVNVEAQLASSHSLLRWMKRLIALRKRYRAFGRGAIRYLTPENHRVLAFVREHERQRILVVANLSRFAQHIELDLVDYRGLRPVELFGHVLFPPVTDRPYGLSLGPHGFYWFSLETAEGSGEPVRVESLYESLPVLGPALPREDRLAGEILSGLERVLPRFLDAQTWFNAPGRRVRGISIEGSIPVDFVDHREHDGGGAWFLLIQVDYTDGDPETYGIFLAEVGPDRAHAVLVERPSSAVARLELQEGGAGLLHEASGDPDFCRSLLQRGAAGRAFRSNGDRLAVTAVRGFRKAVEEAVAADRPSGEGMKQSRSAFTVGRRLEIKLFRRLEAGLNPGVEMLRHLAARRFRHVPRLAATLDHVRGREEPMTVALVLHHVPNRGTARDLAKESLSGFYDRALSLSGPAPVSEKPYHVLDDLHADPPQALLEVGHTGVHLESMRLLGRRTGEFHRASGRRSDVKEFAPEAFTRLYQRALYQSVLTTARRVLRRLSNGLEQRPEAVRSASAWVLENHERLVAHFEVLRGKTLTGKRIRCHGNLGLGQVRVTEGDFVFVGLEGVPTRSLGERRIKRSPFQDVAGMWLSLHQAALAALLDQSQRGMLSRDDITRLVPWAGLWCRASIRAFLAGYLDAIRGTGLLPRKHDERRILLDVLGLEAALLRTEEALDRDPDRVHIPVAFLRQILEAAPSFSGGPS